MTRAPVLIVEWLSIGPLRDDSVLEELNGVPHRDTAWSNHSGVYPHVLVEVAHDVAQDVTVRTDVGIHSLSHHHTTWTRI
jgi:hypothetical protein